MFNRNEIQRLMESEKMDLELKITLQSRIRDVRKIQGKSSIIEIFKKVFSNPRNNSQPDCCAS